jgi:hypothetical protein
VTGYTNSSRNVCFWPDVLLRDLYNFKREATRTLMRRRHPARLLHFNRIFSVGRAVRPLRCAILLCLRSCHYILVVVFVACDSPCPRPAPASQTRGPDSPHGSRAKGLQSVATSWWQLDTRWSSGFRVVLMSRPCSTRLLNLNYSYLTPFLSALRAAQSLLEIRELRIPPANVSQQIRIRATFMRASSAFDDQ